MLPTAPLIVVSTIGPRPGTETGPDLIYYQNVAPDDAAAAFDLAAKTVHVVLGEGGALPQDDALDVGDLYSEARPAGLAYMVVTLHGEEVPVMSVFPFRRGLDPQRFAGSVGLAVSRALERYLLPQVLNASKVVATIGEDSHG